LKENETESPYGRVKKKKKVARAFFRLEETVAGEPARDNNITARASATRSSPLRGVRSSTRIDFWAIKRDMNVHGNVR